MTGIKKRDRIKFREFAELPDEMKEKALLGVKRLNRQVDPQMGHAANLMRFASRRYGQAANDDPVVEGNEKLLVLLTYPNFRKIVLEWEKQGRDLFKTRLYHKD